MNLLAAALAVLFTAATLSAQTDSAWIETAPLQHKLDRLYFGCGLEERIYPDCRFTVTRGKETIYSGCIESAYSGISISYPTARFFDTLRLADLRIRIERAPLDTAATITLGHVGYLPLHIDRPDDSAAPLPIIREYKSQFEMSLAFEQNAIDGCFSYRKTGLPNAGAAVAQPAPFFVAMLPNPARDITRRGFLTTSLYYRLDSQRLPMYFDGDAIRPFNRLCDADPLAPRPFPYAPAQGRTLLENVRSKSRTVSFSVEHSMFTAAAGYFGDILSRDRFQTTVVNDPRKADIRLVTIPIDHSKLASLRYINDLLAADTVAGSPVNETIRIIDGYLRTAALASDTAMREQYLLLAETSLRDDIGVLPLFRPTLFFTPGQGLIGGVFRPDHSIDCSSLQKARLPQGPGACSQ